MQPNHVYETVSLACPFTSVTQVPIESCPDYGIVQIMELLSSPLTEVAGDIFRM